MKTFRAMVITLMLSTAWMAVVFTLFSFIIADIDKDDNMAHSIAVGFRTAWCILPCYLIGNLTRKITKKFDL